MKKAQIATLLLTSMLFLSAYPQDVRKEKGSIEWLRDKTRIEWRNDTVNTDKKSLAEELRIGVEAGAGITRVFSSNLSQPFRINESAGLFLNLNEGGFLFETGLKWHRRNYHLTGFIPQYSRTMVSAQLNPNYLEIPLMAGGMLKLADSNKADIRIGLKIGMYFACGISGNGSILSKDNSGNKTLSDVDNIFKKSHNFDPLKRFDTGGKAGIDLYINRWKIGFEYTRGWIDINKSFDRHVKTKSFDFTIGYTFGYRLNKR